jgi:cytosine/creatinine deaminase
MTDQFFEVALHEARTGLEEGGIPIGSAVVVDGRVIGSGRNRRVQRNSVVLHGEMDALENAGRQPAATYARTTIYTTLSPCDMCSGAILLYGIPKVVVGENRTFLGSEDLLRDQGVEVVVLDDPRAVKMMREFIVANPDLWNEDIGV